MNASVPSANISLYIAEWGEDATMVFATFSTFWVRLPGRAWPGAGDRGRIECFELQLSEHKAREVAWLFPLAWVPVESTPNSCLWGGTQAKAILVSYLLEVTGILLHMF